jgi:hypothetical protein
MLSLNWQDLLVALQIFIMLPFGGSFGISVKRNRTVSRFGIRNLTQSSPASLFPVALLTTLTPRCPMLPMLKFSPDMWTLHMPTVLKLDARWKPTSSLSMVLSSHIMPRSTDAEFITAVSAAKAAEYLHVILIELGILKLTPTIIYEDNAAVIMMANAGRPTKHSHHIDIQLFALQQWIKYGHVILSHVRGTTNPSDALIKELGWVLHHRHCTRIMGVTGTPYTTMTGHIFGSSELSCR